MMHDGEVLDYKLLSRELLRGVRGRRSQESLSKKLGYASNVISGWETGNRSPHVSDFLRLAAFCRFDVPAIIASFVKPATPDWLPDHGRDWNATHTRMFLNDVRLGISATDAAAWCDQSLHSIRRWFSGRSEPKLHDFLQLLEGCTFRALEWIQYFVDPNTIPSVGDRWSNYQNLRAQSRELPWLGAVSCCLALEGYQALPSHSDAWIAERLQLSTERVTQSISVLSQLGLYVWDGRLWQRTNARSIVMPYAKYDDAALKRLYTHWSTVAAAGIEKNIGEHVVFTTAVSERVLNKLYDMQRQFFNDLVHQCETLRDPNEAREHVVAYCGHLVPLERD